MKHGQRNGLDEAFAAQRIDVVSFSDLRTCRVGPGYYLMLMRQREKDRVATRRSLVGRFQRLELAQVL